MSDEEITIVIVEDKEVRRLALKRSLGECQGFRVTGEASDGLTALHKAMDLKPKVIMIDAGLPVMDGLEVTRQIRECVPDARILMMASQGSGIDIFEVIGAGASAYFEKNTETEQIEIAVRTAACGGAWLDRTIAERVLRSAAAGAMAAAVEDSVKGKLSQREHEVLRLVVDGLSNNDIAQRLCISIETVKTHIRHIIEKLGVHSRTEAAVRAIQHNLTDHRNSAGA
jgi:two-component system, NarL family, response regulator LiaR